MPVSDLKCFKMRSCLAKNNRVFQLRLSRARDAAQVIAAISAVCAERVYLETDCYISTPQWERVLYTPLHYADHLLLIPELQGQVIGWCRIFPVSNSPKAQHVGDVGIGLLKHFREIGIGTALMECAIEWAKAQRLEKLTASTFSTNLRAINLFEKVGFATIGVKRQQYKVDGKYVDQVLIERFL